jgi:hypothetical protein
VKWSHLEDLEGFLNRCLTRRKLWYFLRIKVRSFDEVKAHPAVPNPERLGGKIGETADRKYASNVTG